MASDLTRLLSRIKNEGFWVNKVLQSGLMTCGNKLNVGPIPYNIPSLRRLTSVY